MGKAGVVMTCESDVTVAGHDLALLLLLSTPADGRISHQQPNQAIISTIADQVAFEFTLDILQHAAQSLCMGEKAGSQTASRYAVVRMRLSTVGSWEHQWLNSARKLGTGL